MKTTESKWAQERVLHNMRKLIFLALLLIVSTGATTTSDKYYEVKVTMQVDHYRKTEIIIVRANSSNSARTRAIEQARRRMSVKVVNIKPSKP